MTKKLHTPQFVEKIQVDSPKKLLIDKFEKTFSNYLLKNEVEISLFEFRETFERYVGLTLSLSENSENDEIVPTESELFRIAGHQNATLGQICLQRRNRSRLLIHQNNAREDLLKIFAKMHSSVVDSRKLEFSLIEFFNLIEDFEANTALSEIFRQPSQTERTFPVQELEIDVWNSKENKPLPTQPQTILSLPNMTATTAMPKPD